MPRPSRDAELRRVRDLAGVNDASIRSFFSRPERLSADRRQRIAAAVAQVGYRPHHPMRGVLAGLRVGVEIPRTYAPSGPSGVMSSQFVELVVACQRRGATVVPFVVDPHVPGLEGVVGGSEDERADPRTGSVAWSRDYADSLASHEYERVLRRSRVRGFVVNDLKVDDLRLAALLSLGVPYVAMGVPLRRTETGSLVVDERHAYVENDNDAGTARMVALLREAGCRTFAHLGFADDRSAVPAARRRAIDAILGPVPRHVVHYVQVQNPKSVEGVRDWLRSEDLVQVDAVVCDSDSLAALVRDAAPDAGRQVVRDPRDVGAGDSGLRPLAICGNDAAPVRTLGAADARGWWMTMRADGPRVADVVLDTLVTLLDPTAGGPTSTMVPPVMVGELGSGPTCERRLADA